MILLQRLFMVILNPLYKITGKLSDGVRTKLMGFAWFVLVAISYAYYAKDIFHLHQNYSKEGFLAMIPLIIVIVLSVDRPLKPVNWNRWLCGIWFLCGGILLVCTVLFDMGRGFFPFAISMFFVFPCLYFVWNNRRDYDILFSQVSRAVIANFLIGFVLCIIMAPVTADHMMDSRYLGIVDNPNNLGMIAAGTVAACLYLIAKNDRFSWVYIIPCELAVSMELLSASRTSFVAIGFMAVIFLLFFFKYYLWAASGKIKALIKVIVLGVLVVVCFPLNKDILSLKANEVAESANAVYVVSAQPLEMGIEQEPVAEGNEDTGLALFDRIGLKSAGLDELSSGRIQIWKTYINHIGFKGHTSKNSPAKKETGLWAHNVFIEMAYRGGLLEGILYILIVLTVVFYVLRSFFRKKYFTDTCLFTALTAGCFGVISMFEMAVFPLEREFILLFYVAIAPLFAAEKGKRKENERI